MKKKKKFDLFDLIAEYKREDKEKKLQQEKEEFLKHHVNPFMEYAKLRKESKTNVLESNLQRRKNILSTM